MPLYSCTCTMIHNENASYISHRKSSGVEKVLILREKRGGDHLGDPITRISNAHLCNMITTSNLVGRYLHTYSRRRRRRKIKNTLDTSLYSISLLQALHMLLSSTTHIIYMCIYTAQSTFDLESSLNAPTFLRNTYTRIPRLFSFFSLFFFNASPSFSSKTFLDFD